MKAIVQNLWIFGLILQLSACGSSRPVASDRPASPNLVQNQGDEEEYEVTIIDPDFDRWCSINCRPISYHSPDFYAAQNRRYVSAWNSLASRPVASPNYPFQNRIDYDLNTDYGVELNHKLYWYFKYIEQTVGQRYGFP